MKMTALENNFNFDWKNNSSSKLSKELEKNFNEKNLAEFKKQMAQIEKDVDPRFLDMFREYEQKVSSLLSENLFVVGSKVVQEELVKQNARIAGTFQKDSIKLQKAYSDIFWWEEDLAA